MAVCPECGADSKTDPGALVVADVYTAREPGSHSLSGHQMKVSVIRQLELRCERCGWAIRGWISGDQFIAGAPDQR